MSGMSAVHGPHVGDEKTSMTGLPALRSDSSVWASPYMPSSLNEGAGVPSGRPAPQSAAESSHRSRWNIDARQAVVDRVESQQQATVLTNHLELKPGEPTNDRNQQQHRKRQEALEVGEVIEPTDGARPASSQPKTTMNRATAAKIPSRTRVAAPIGSEWILPKQ